MVVGTQKKRRAFQFLICTFLAAIFPLKARADDFVPPKITTQTPNGVNISDSSFSFSVTDLSIGPLSLDRFHLGGFKDPNLPFFGPRMTDNFDIYVAPNFTKAAPPRFPARYKPIVHVGDVATGTYYQTIASPPTITSSSDDAHAGKLTLVSGAYVYTDQAGAVYTFNPNVHAGGPADQGAVSQRVASIVHADGEALNFSYNSSGQLKEVSDSTGYAIIFDYGSNGNPSAACGYDLSSAYVTPTSTCATASLKVSYTYTGNFLTGVTDVLGNVTNYTVSGSAITCVKPPGYTTCKINNTYSNTYQVSHQTLADGSIWQSSSSDFADASRDPNYIADDGDQTAIITDPLGKVTHYNFTKSSPYEIVDANGHATNYRFTGGEEVDQTYSQPMHDGQMLIEVDFPEGNKYLATYESTNYNVLSMMTLQAKPGSGLPDRIVSYAFNNCFGNTIANCTKPIWKIDPNGNRTDYVYNDRGQILSEMNPAPTSGAARPLKLYDYVQKYAYVKNAGGALVPAAAPIWVANSETDCQTVAGSSSAMCDSGAPQVVTTYQYGADGTADNLLLRGKAVTSGGVTLRTCYGYDAQSNKISETSPRAGLSTCP